MIQFVHTHNHLQDHETDKMCKGKMYKGDMYKGEIDKDDKDKDKMDKDEMYNRVRPSHLAVNVIVNALYSNNICSQIDSLYKM